MGIKLARQKDDRDADRYLTQRGRWWYYQRKVPASARAGDDRFPKFRVALGTQSIADARKARDLLDLADSSMWGAIDAGDNSRSHAQHVAAVRRVEALGFAYKPAAEIAKQPGLEEILQRIEAMGKASAPVHIEKALLGVTPAPVALLSQAYDLYSSEIAASELVGKSDQQKRKWRNVKQRAVDAFIDVVGDIDIGQISRDDALKLWRTWQKRIAPTGLGEKPTHTASSGNRDIGSLRTIYGEYFKHIGQMDRANPFAGLSFKERGASKRKRPPFPVDWIRDSIMAPGALETMNDDARGILLAMIETGARPSELANIRAASIHIDVDVPHIAIEPRDDPNDPRELKSEQSDRVIPLVGVALDVFRAHRDGFPQYREREEAASAAINKFLRGNGLMPSPRHTIYGLRHSLEDRMKEAGIGDELRRILMGHKVDREEYGTGGSLRWRRDELLKIVLPHDPVIVTQSRKAISRRGPGRKKA